MMEVLHKLQEKIQEKKELSGIAKTLVRKEILLYLHREPKAKTVLDQFKNPRSAVYKSVIKDVRALLRRKYGLFHAENVVGTKSGTLAAHSSTSERLSFYPQLYEHIFSITGKPQVMVDLGCGLNPLSLPLMNLHHITYYAYDVNETDLHIVQIFFDRYKTKHQGFNGHVAVLDLFDIEQLSSLPTSDVCFLFKVTDLLDAGKGHKASEKVISTVPARFVVVSFPTKTMSGKPMNAPRRRWMEWMCQRIGYEYTILEFENEIFYVIEKDFFDKAGHN